MVINIKEINKKYSTKNIFNNLSLDIAGGEMVCLYGPSGCGKTTLLNMIGLIEPIDSGSIYYNQNKVISKKHKETLLRKDIGFLFQNFGLVDNETVEQNLDMLYVLHKMRKKERLHKINQALSQVGLTNYNHKKIYECSGGEQQRVALAKIIIKDCSIVLADEPTASLDEQNKKMVMNHFIEFNRAGKTIIIASHDEDIKNMCDRVIYM